jgi:DNA-binding transcriptional regulator GbsR (MarR family)
VSASAPAAADRPTADDGDAVGSSGETPDAHREAVDRFIAFWGRMASTWGINRTMAQIHALLYCSEAPLNTDDIMARLDISRGNANMNLRSLTDWNLVSKTHLPESRKDFYVAEKDVWTITAQIIRERERREIQPVRDQLEACVDRLVPNPDALDEHPEADRILYRRLDNLIELMEVFEGFSEALLPLVRSKNVEMVEQLVAIARAIDAASAEDASDRSSPSNAS